MYTLHTLTTATTTIKDLGHSSYTSRVIARFVSNFVAMATRISWAWI